MGPDDVFVFDAWTHPELRRKRIGLSAIVPMARTWRADGATRLVGTIEPENAAAFATHEFLPVTKTAREALAQRLGIPVRMLERRVVALKEANPMLGHRGCRLAITYPEILRMQVKAITQATIACRRDRIDAGLGALLVRLTAGCAGDPDTTQQ